MAELKAQTNYTEDDIKEAFYFIKTDINNLTKYYEDQLSTNE